MFSDRKHFNKCKFTHNSDSVLQFGRLSVSVHNKLNNEPISFAVVSIYHLTIRGLYGEQGEANLIVRHVTDNDGNIPIVELPIIDRRNSPMSQYYMTVTHFRYFPVNTMNIQIYPNITTEYNISLTPTTERHPDYEFIITPDLIM